MIATAIILTGLGSYAMRAFFYLCVGEVLLSPHYA